MFIALGGSSYAAVKITGKDVRNGTLSGADIRNGTLSGADIRRNSVAGGDVRNGSLAARDFEPGALPGTTRWLLINESGGTAIGRCNTAAINCMPAGTNIDTTLVVRALADNTNVASQTRRVYVQVTP
jgi:uncharacterized protein YjbI with pentapeptide repeats